MPAIQARGFTLIEVIIGVSVFVLFALGIYSGTTAVLKIVYASRTATIEQTILAEQLEIIHNLPYEKIGLSTVDPGGVVPQVQTIKRNGINFTVTTAIASVDDPYDGLASSVPSDTAPADYKKIELSIICALCQQKKPFIGSTLVAPKRLEGGVQNGALFVHAFNAAGNDVSGANVHIYTTGITPPITADNVTDNNGMFRLINTPTGTLAYHIRVSKAGYSSDYTVSPTTTNNSDSVKLPASVAEQTTTEINFSIDELANLTIHTLNPDCSPISNQKLLITGNKLLATNPDLPKFSQTITTNAQGLYQFPNLEWDSYAVSSSEKSYDFFGSVPMLPLNITPGLTQEASLILVPHTKTTLLVKVHDAGTGLPLSNASVELVANNYDTTLITGVGYNRQTDWSGGAGQALFTKDDQYFSDDGNLDIKSPKGDIVLKKSGKYYLTSGWLESSTFDLGTAVNFNNVLWEPFAQPAQTGTNPIRIQIATSNTQTPASWNFTGPDGTTGTFYTATSTLINSNNNGQRYLRYRLFLATADTNYTPNFSEIAFTYITSCTPPGQTFFGNLNKDTYTITVSRNGYTTSTGSIEINDNEETEVDLSSE